MGLPGSRWSAVMTDRTEHAVKEGDYVLASLHAEAQENQQSTDWDKKQMAIRENCCIHGIALEERFGMQTAFPEGYLVNALHLLCVLITSPESGRKGYYRNVWDVEFKLDSTAMTSKPSIKHSVS